MDKFTELRGKYETFIYHSYQINDEGFSFHFSIGGYDFRPEWKWNGLNIPDSIDKGLIGYIIFSIGMVELVSYWKCACPPRVIVECGSLCAEQTEWWKRLYWGGLGEFFYRNGIHTDFDSFMTIEADNADIPQFTDCCSEEKKGCIIPVGGGKDSIVTLELLRDMHKDSYCFMVGGTKTRLDCAHTAGFPDERIIALSRTIDPELLRRNADGWLNGHTPFSAIVAFSAYLCAVITGRRYIVLSNESSANEGNVNGSGVNHQYSKSTAFERDFREYCAKWFVTPPEYFSLLRPWSEWQITKKFVTYPRYLNVFRSCNVGSKKDIWCGKCAKCLYVYIMLAAFLDDGRLREIFGRDMLDDPEMQPIFDGLVYPDLDKPFECVGTRAEIRLALRHAYRRREGGNVPLLLKNYIADNNETPDELDSHFDSDNFVPAELIGLLKG